MRQTYNLALGASLLGATLPDGSPAFAVAIDNPSGEWLDVYPLGQPIPPLTVGVVIAFPGGAPSVDVRYSPLGVGGAPSVALGDVLTVTLFDEDEAPPSDRGSLFVPTTHRRTVAGTMPVSTSLTGLAFTGADVGRLIRSILVSNPSQAWLTVAGYGVQVPPSTVGWAIVLPDAPLTVTLTAAATGPDGAPSVQLGDAPSVTLFDDQSAGGGAGNAYAPIGRKASVTAATTATATTAFAFSGADAGRLVSTAVVDNPSGQWLRVTAHTTGAGDRVDYVSPYFTGAQLRYAAPVASIDVAPGVAPDAGQTSTTAGSPYTLTIFDSQGNAPDLGYLAGFTSMPTFDVVGVANALGTASPVLVAAVAGKRIRVRSWSVNKGINDYGPCLSSLITNPGGAPLDQLSIYTGEQRADRTFAGEGVDLPVGIGLSATVTAAWVRVNFEITGTYQVV